MHRAVRNESGYLVFTDSRTFADRAAAIAGGFVSVREIAERFGVAEPTAKRWVSGHRFPEPTGQLVTHIKPARLWKWRDVLAHVEKRNTDA